jgi:hypothetical protein
VTPEIICRPLPLRLVVDWPVGADPIELQDALASIGIVLRTDAGDGDGDALERVLDSIDVLDVVDIPNVCSECGCTDDYGCDPPCSWITDDFCSECALRTLRAGGHPG